MWNAAILYLKRSIATECFAKGSVCICAMGSLCVLCKSVQERYYVFTPVGFCLTYKSV